MFDSAATAGNPVLSSATVMAAVEDPSQFASLRCGMNSARTCAVCSPSAGTGP
jgi:hypothetical protein